ncbi:hypothetical protein HDU79_011715 [Rhizoclosmatium sp. JEL0117]|nr:hypothetical protein HDU79_011715 [Rhizoclosmatium sp. JEL0117]
MIDEDEAQTGSNTGQGGKYHWEAAYQRSWDALEEDDSGSLAAHVAALAREKLARRRHVLALSNSAVPVHRGLIRHQFLVLDMSEAIASPADYLLPTRLECVLHNAQVYVDHFLTVNPLGCIGLIATRDGGAEKYTELTGNTAEHIAAIQNKSNREPRGEPSLQNALEIARRSLLHVPSHGSREILVLYSALTTCDPGNISETIQSLKADNIRVSIIGLSAEMRICKHICKETKGIYNVIMNEQHLKEVLASHVAPPAVESEKTASLAMIEMGFPSSTSFASPTICANHGKPTQIGYECPRCKTTICSLPTDCPICSLTLVSSVLLARSYHHLFPVPPFVEIPVSHRTSHFSLSLAAQIQLIVVHVKWHSLLYQQI